MKYPFEFSECKLDNTILEKLGFVDWWGGSGDFSESYSKELGFRIQVTDERVCYWSGDFCDEHYFNIDGNCRFHFLHDLLLFVREHHNENYNNFLELCKKENLYHYVKDYLEYEKEIQV